MKSYIAGFAVTFLLLSAVSSADDTYTLMRQAISHDRTVNTLVMIESMTQFACAMKVVESSAYHRGLLDGTTKAGGECFKTSQEPKKMSITVRVESCDNKDKWLTFQYYCELTADEREKEQGK